MIRRIQVILLVTSLIITSVFTPAYAGDADAYAESANEVIFSQDFENASIDKLGGLIVNTTDPLSVGSVDSAHGKSLGFNASGTRNLQMQLPVGEVYDGCFLLSYDLYLTNSQIFSYIKMNQQEVKAYSGDEYIVPADLFATKNGKFGYYYNGNTALNRTHGIVTEVADVEANTWNRINIWIDFYQRRFHICINDSYYASSWFELNVTLLDKFMFMIDRSSGNAYLDNISLTKVISPKATGEVVPPEMEYLDYPIDVDITGGCPGNIFHTGQKPSFFTKVKNRTDEDCEWKVTYTVKNEYSENVWKGTDSFTVKASDVWESDFSTAIDTYGLYTLDAVFESGAQTVNFSTVFSLANIPDKGKKNEKLSVNGGIQIASIIDDVDSVYPIIDAAGFSKSRENMFMRWWKPELGDDGMQEKLKDELKAGQNAGVGMTYLLYGWDGSWGDIGTVEGAKRYGEEAYKAVKALKGRVKYYEVWNEPSYGYTPEQYAEMLRYAYLGIKKADPDAKVVGFSMAGTDSKWIQRTLDALGPGKWMDVISFHPYSFSVDPEAGGLVEKVTELKALMRKNGYTDGKYGELEYMASELGWSTSTNHYNTEEDQAVYLVRMQLLNDAYDLMDDIEIFCLYDSGLEENYHEDRFGLVRPAVRSKLFPVAYAAKPSYLAVTNFNKMVYGASFAEKADVGNDNVYAYRYKRASDGKSFLAIGTFGGDETVSLSLNADSVTVYDLYGNAQTQYPIDGSYMFRLSKRIMYIEGDFDTVSASDSHVELKDFDVSTAPDMVSSFSVIKNTDDEMSVNVKSLGDIEIVENSGFSGNTAVVRYKSKGMPADNDRVRVSLEGGGKTYFSTQLPVSYKDSVEISDPVIYPYSNGLTKKWVASFTVTNIRNDENVSGKIVFKEPQLICDTVKYTDIPSLAPGESRTVTFYFPQNVSTDGDLTMQIELNTGEVFTKSAEMISDVVSYTETPPVLDGNISDGEWNFEYPMIINDISNVQKITDWGGEEDLSARAAAAWDKENLYLAFEVTDNNHVQDKDDSTIWAGDSVQFAIACSPDSSIGTEICAALTEDGAKAYMYSSETGMTLTSEQYKNCKAAISRQGSKTVYEISLPWSDLAPDTQLIKKYGVVRLSLLINDDDGSGRRGWMEYGSGIGTTKTAALYKRAVLAK